MDYQQDKIRVICDQLDALRQSTAMVLDGFEFCPAGYKGETGVSPEDGWKKWDSHRTFSGHDAHYWFRTHFTAPAPQEGKALFFHLSTGQGDWDSVNPQGIVYLNGALTQGVDINHRLVKLEPGREYDLQVYMYTSLLRHVEARFDAELRWIDEDVEGLYYDLKVPLDATACMEAGCSDYWTIMRHLEVAVGMLDLRKPGSEAFRASAQAAREYLKEEFYGKVCGGHAPVVHTVGHTHIDVAWLWTLAQTEEKAQRSFSTVLRLMEQYPEFIFMSSQPQLYEYIKKNAPDLYRQIQERVRQGRWEVEGAMWLEADCNLTSGESLVRQVLHGKRFMQQEFGVDSHILWLPDVFGYSAALPQILRKAGVDRFFTTKIGWNETNKMPFDAFMWEGIDGTEIFTHFGTARNLPKPGENDTNTTYVCTTEPTMVKGTWERFQQKEYSDKTLITFGFGDGGGGPTRHMLEVLRRTSQGLPGLPRTKMSTAGAFMDGLYDDMAARAAVSGRMPKWVGELYLEFHRGTYTSIARNKRNNRKSELLLQKAETLSVISNALVGTEYPKQALYDNWQTVLLNQFHDIIPGSSIREVYEDSDRQYAGVLESTGAIADNALSALASQVSGEGLLVYNPLGFARSGLVTWENEGYWAEDVPAMGWKVIEKVPNLSHVRADSRHLENDCLRLELDETGAICSLFDKRANRELCKEGSRINELRVYEDFPRDYDAWELSRYYKDKMWVADEVLSAQVVDEGGRKGIRLTKPYGDSTIIQTIYLTDGSARIDFETRVDWHQRHQLLKAVFPLDLHANQATYEIQFGHVSRPTHSNTSWDAAKFEVCAQKWADIGENGYGVSLINDCKYGHSAEGSTLTLSLLKSATYPNPEADQGEHVFTYALYPHVGDFREAGTIREAYALNQPMTAVPCDGTGALPDSFSLVSCDQPGVIVETVKQAEDGGDIIVRLYDAFDRRSKATLTIGIPFSKVELCDLMENPMDSSCLEVQGQNVTLPVKNFEIVTLRIHR
ncbi:MAG: alpha-mannosidase [Candidatus Faecousia sp.]|nr:alpha-mannosidase [Candidatus Faecousia sp.]